jgi:hypothetical protein
MNNDWAIAERDQTAQRRDRKPALLGCDLEGNDGVIVVAVRSVVMGGLVRGVPP